MRAPPNSPTPSPFMSILHGFAASSARLARAASEVDEWIEKEIHPLGDRPVGSGWVRTAIEAGYGIWERRRVTLVPR